MTVENVSGVMENVAVDIRKWVWSRCSIVPHPQLEEIYHKYSTEEQRIHACADCYVNCHPDSSWTDLCQRHFWEEEMTAARKAKTFIPHTGEWCQPLSPTQTCIIDLQILIPSTENDVSQTMISYVTKISRIYSSRPHYDC